MKIINVLPKHYLEHQYFNKMIQFFDENVFKDKVVIISHDYSKLPEYGKNIIVILTAGDEKGKPPKYSNEVGFVFKHHLDSDNIGNVYHIPLPYPNKFSGNYKIPILERKYDVFFSGCRRGSRKVFESVVRDYTKKTKRNVFIKLTNKFMTGLSIKEYSKVMSDSKIVLNPRGWVRSECIRFTEAVRCGCTIISEPQPKLSIFDRCPYVSIDNWNKLDETVETILQYKMNLQRMNTGMVQSWNDDFCPQAIAKKINKIVGGKK